jgi:hypothetical protein
MAAAAAIHAKTTRTRSKAIHGAWRRIGRRFGALERGSRSEEGGAEGGVMGGSTIRSFQRGKSRMNKRYLRSREECLQRS